MPSKTPARKPAAKRAFGRVASTRASFETLARQFKLEITDRASDVDPSSEHDWHSLSLGWAIAKGLPIDRAHSFATELRYGTELA